MVDFFPDETLMSFKMKGLRKSAILDIFKCQLSRYKAPVR